MGRKARSAQLKTKVGLEALYGQKTVKEIAEEYKVHPTQVNQWKKQTLEFVISGFSKGKEISPKTTQESALSSLLKEVDKYFESEEPEDSEELEESEE